MVGNRQIIKTMLVALVAVALSEVCYSQGRAEEPQFNALEYRNLPSNREAVRYSSESNPFSRLYVTLGVGSESVWDAVDNPNGGMNSGFTSRASVGYSFSPLHALEFNVSSSDTPYVTSEGVIENSSSFGVGLDYVLNLSNVVSRQNKFNYVDVFLLTGLNYREHLDVNRFGANAALRIQYNAVANMGIFIEPRMSFYGGENPVGVMKTAVQGYSSINVGLSFNFRDQGEMELPAFALKTNLLFDAVSLINIGVEVPIGLNWSVGGTWIFPWWTNDDSSETSDRNRTQIMSGTLEGRYWFGERESRDQLTGWFAGVYAGGGIYDVERDHEGYQGDFYLMGGLCGGYAHTLNLSGSLRMEYVLGVGYLESDYEKYETYWGIDDLWHPIRKESATVSWFGPTKAEISLVWMLNRNAKRGGQR